MKAIFSFAYILCMSLIVVLATNNSFIDTGLLLVILIINLIDYKFKVNKWTAIFEMFILIVATSLNPVFAYFFGMITYKLIVQKLYLALVPILLASFVFSKHIELEVLIPTMLLSAYFACNISAISEKNLALEKKQDNERFLLSATENEMSIMSESLEKVEHLAKLSERNRIAMDIHDNVGHSIAGVLMQLQAAKKVEGVDKYKSNELYEASTKKLASTLEMLREIVHDLKPSNPLDLEHIKWIVSEFEFCDIDATYTGNFARISAVHLEIITTILKESLTNIIRHSRASSVKLGIESNKKFIRLYIKDNGIGCDSIMENLGIRSMRTRVENVGGNFSIGNDNGIVIVCMIFTGNA